MRPATRGKKNVNAQAGDSATNDRALIDWRGFFAGTARRPHGDRGQGYLDPRSHSAIGNSNPSRGKKKNALSKKHTKKAQGIIATARGPFPALNRSQTK